MSNIWGYHMIEGRDSVFENVRPGRRVLFMFHVCMAIISTMLEIHGVVHNVQCKCGREGVHKV